MLMSEDPYLPTFLVLKLSWKQKKKWINNKRLHTKKVGRKGSLHLIALRPG